MLFFRNKNQQPELLEKRIILLFLIPVSLLLVYGFCLVSQPDPWQLVVRASALDEINYTFPVEKNDRFDLSYIHSVSNRPVSGTFVITDRAKIKPLTTKFDSFGPGLPDLDSSIEYEIRDGLIIVYHDEDPREQIRLFVSPLTGEKLIIHGKEYDLTFRKESPLLIEIFILTKQ
jgi:hypothetical protein